MKFDRQKFFAGYRDHFGPLSQKQVAGLNFILDAAELDAYVTDVRWLAYMLATTKHETADTFQPIHEYGSHAYFVRRYGSQTKIGKQLGNDTAEEGAIYAGRGDVQLTGETNYEKAEDALRSDYPDLVAQYEARTGKTFDLTVGDQPNDDRDPDAAMDPVIAYAIMSFGMRTGMFTGRKLSDFLNDKRTDYKNARRIINGTDEATKIAGYAHEFEDILTSAELAEDPTTALPGQLQGEQNSDPKNTLTSDQSSAAQPSLETKVVDAPPAEQTVAKSAGTVVAGIVVPGFIIAIFKTIGELVSQGYLNAKEIGDSVINFAISNTKWFFILLVTFMLVLVANKAFKQITLWIQMWIKSRPDLHDVEVKPQ
jgi:putative chitinase